MTHKTITVTPRRSTPANVTLQIELPALSNEAAAAIADVLVQLYHRFEAAYYAQILSHHADQAFTVNVTAAARNKPASTDPF
jgi:hypothetical protein